MLFQIHSYFQQLIQEITIIKNQLTRSFILQNLIYPFPHACQLKQINTMSQVIQLLNMYIFVLIEAQQLISLQTTLCIQQLIIFSMINQQWYFSQINQFKASKWVTTKSNCSSQQFLRCQSIQQSHCTSLTKPSYKYSSAYIFLLNTLIFPKIPLLFYMAINNSQRFFYLFNRKYCLIIWRIYYSKLFYIIPARHFHSTICCYFPNWSMDQFNTRAIMNWRLLHLKEIRKTSWTITQSVQPKQCVFRIAFCQNQRFINFVSDQLDHCFHYNFQPIKMHISQINKHKETKDQMNNIYLNITLNSNYFILSFKKISISQRSTIRFLKNFNLIIIYLMSNHLTTSTGQPVDDNQNSVTAGQYGPVVISDFHLIDKLAHFDRQRIPQRVVHAKGAGAHGYFKVTHDVSKYTKAKVFQSVGKVTPTFARFSTVAGQKGSPDTWRDPRGFAVKFYTEQGNWDMTGNNTPVFFIRDPIKFPDFIHSQKKDPKTNLPSALTAWDFWSLSPESTHQVTILMSDRGTPDGFRHMNGYASHTFKWINANGEAHYVKLHFKTKSGIKNFNAQQALDLYKDPDYATRDLANHLMNGGTAQWDLFIQAIPEKDALSYKWNIFDVTKVVPHGDYPLIPVGTLVLNKTVENYFAETQQSAFSPGHLVPGMQPSVDKMLQGRLFSYPDTHRHRLGANYEQIPINCPYRAKVSNGIRDGPMRVDGNQGSNLNYQPNSSKGANTFAFNKSARYEPYRVTGLVARHRPNHPNCDFTQPGNLFRKVMNDSQRKATIANVIGHMQGVPRDIQERAVKNFYKADSQFGEGIAKGLGFSATKPRL